MHSKSWKPPFCPNPSCNSHKTLSNTCFFRKAGTFPSNHSGLIPRFRCTSCGKYMSQSTFDVEFRAKLRMNLPDIADALCTGVRIRAIARKYKVGTCPIINRAKRLARQAISLQTAARKGFILKENLVADGLESFVRSQYYPNHHTILIGADSQYCHLADFAVFRRKGAMTENQRQRRADLDQTSNFPKASIKTSFKRILSLVNDLTSQEAFGFLLHTDEHPRYQEAVFEFKTTIEKQGGKLKFSHKTTSSKLTRTSDNPLFAVNYFDREIRKDLANHTRETTQWSHESNSSMNRFYLYLAMHNFLKKFRIRGNDHRTHAEVAGIAQPICHNAQKYLFEERAFLSRTNGISESESTTWLQKWPNPWSNKISKVWPYMVS